MKSKFKVTDKVKVSIKAKEEKYFTGVITKVTKRERPNFFGSEYLSSFEYRVKADDDGIEYACSESRITKV